MQHIGTAAAALGSAAIIIMSVTLVVRHTDELHQKSTLCAYQLQRNTWVHLESLLVETRR
jgi:hypothetical protein